jgi:hypothetical protein
VKNARKWFLFSASYNFFVPFYQFRPFVVQLFYRFELFVSVVVFFLAGCGGSVPTAVSEAPAATSAPEQAAATPEPSTATPVPPTATPVPPTPTPEPPTATPTPSGPKAGHWEGKPSVSLEVTTDGNIRDFKITFPFGPSQKDCTLQMQDTIIVEADGTFVRTASGTPPAPGAKIEEAYFKGKFESATTLTGTYAFYSCGGVLMFTPTEGTWNAEWKQP